MKESYESFQECRRFYMSMSCESSLRLGKGLKLVETITDPVKEMSYSQAFKDLYISYQEDVGNSASVWTLLQEARDLEQKLSNVPEIVATVFKPIPGSGRSNRSRSKTALAADIWNYEISRSLSQGESTGEDSREGSLGRQAGIQGPLSGSVPRPTTETSGEAGDVIFIRSPKSIPGKDGQEQSPQFNK